MNWRTIVASVLVTAYLLMAVQTGNWGAGIHLLLIAAAIFGKGQQEAEKARGGIIEAPTESPLMQAFEALRADGTSDFGSREAVAEQTSEEEDLTPMMPDADYARIANYLSQRMPFLTVNSLYDPTMRRFIETQILEGRGIGDLEQMLGIPPAAAQVRHMESYGTAIDPRMQAARDQNQRQIDGLIAAIPKSQTTAGIVREAQGRHFRQHRPRALLIMAGIKEGSRLLRERARPGRMQIQIARALKDGIHSGMPELQPLRAPITRIGRDGRLTSASTELRSVPPRFIR